MKKRMLSLAITLLSAMVSAACTNEHTNRIHAESDSDRVYATGPYNGKNNDTTSWAFSYGFDSAMYCGSNPESWVLASANLDRRTGVAVIHTKLITDSMSGGPKGYALLTFHDGHGNILRAIKSNELSRGGKGGGRAEYTDFSGVELVPTSLARQTTELRVTAICSGTSTIHLPKIDDIIKLVVFLGGVL